MKDELVGFDVAKLAKEKGFDWECDWVYTDETGYQDKLTKLRYFDGDGAGYTTNSTLTDNITSETSWLFTAPTQSLLQRWLREVHNIHLTIRPMSLIGFVQYYDIHILEPGKPWDQSIKVTGETYEQVLEQGLFEALKLIK